ncbi:MAG: hypothetical protein ABI760_02355 [Ferruginibacter sp.]
MAKIVYACVRDIDHAALIKERIESVIYKLVPDNIPDARCKVVDLGQIIYGISTLSGGIAETNNSVCMGMAGTSTGKWWKPNSEHPEGSYAIFRADEEYVEAFTDMGCSRAIWYYYDDAVFIAGTSQRAVINVAGKFELERRNIPWMLSSGTLAPSLSWCKNLHFVNPDCAVSLNRKTWQLTIKSGSPEYHVTKTPDKEFQQEFKKLLLDSFSNLEVDLSKWILPLSGGYDSRGIACLLKETGKDISRLNTITWGIGASEKNRISDGYLGGAAAKSLGMKHKFCATDNVKETAEKVFERFILSSEGRTDHIGGYTDGMAIWKYIFDTGKYGIIRGDETFGGPHSYSILRSRNLVGCRLCSDFSNLENFEQYGFEKQVLPENLKEIPGKDTPGLYRDRLYNEFRMPFILSALSDIKYAYTEVMNPFLTREIILKSRTLPDHLRNNKLLFKKIIDEISPKIPYATEDATYLNERLLRNPAAVRIFSGEIGLDYMKEIFPEEFLAKVLIKLQEPSAPLRGRIVGKLKGVMNRSLPVSVMDNLRSNMPKPAIDIRVLAFRIYIIGKMYKMFMEDVKGVNDDTRLLYPSGSHLVTS